MEPEGMTNTEITVLLETLAKLVEATATDAADAARIIREAIPRQQKDSRPPARVAATSHSKRRRLRPAA